MKDLVLKCLKFSISKDETKLYMNGVYYNPKDQEAVSTDGYILTVSKMLYKPEFKDLIVDFNNMTIIEMEYLKYQAVIPKKFNTEFEIYIPKDSIIKGKNQKEYNAYITKEAEVIISRETPKEFLVKINPHFLKPLQGYNLKVGINGELNPIKFELIEDDSYYVVMPLRPYV